MPAVRHVAAGWRSLVFLVLAAFIFAVVGTACCASSVVRASGQAFLKGTYFEAGLHSGAYFGATYVPCLRANGTEPARERCRQARQSSTLTEWFFARDVTSSRCVCLLLLRVAYTRENPPLNYHHYAGAMYDTGTGFALTSGWTGAPSLLPRVA